MARNAMGAKALQLFRGGLNALAVNPWVQNLGGSCCDPVATVAQDRLNPTINPENALVHTRPIGSRDAWQFSEHADSVRDRIVAHINANGVGTQLEILVIPTFSFLLAAHVVVMAEEAGLTFELKTRNGLALPNDRRIKVAETDSPDGCGPVTRVQTAPANLAGLGPLGSATRVHTIGLATDGGKFALEADVLMLEVTAVPAEPVKGFFDIRVYASYATHGRSEAIR